jgi:hypothetical protein
VTAKFICRVRGSAPQRQGAQQAGNYHRSTKLFCGLAVSRLKDCAVVPREKAFGLDWPPPRKGQAPRFVISARRPAVCDPPAARRARGGPPNRRGAIPALIDAGGLSTKLISGIAKLTATGHGSMFSGASITRRIRRLTSVSGRKACHPVVRAAAPPCWRRHGLPRSHARPCFGCRKRSDASRSLMRHGLR